MGSLIYFLLVCAFTGAVPVAFKGANQAATIDLQAEDAEDENTRRYQVWCAVTIDTRWDGRFMIEGVDSGTNIPQIGNLDTSDATKDAVESQIACMAFLMVADSYQEMEDAYANDNCGLTASGGDIDPSNPMWNQLTSMFPFEMFKAMHDDSIQRQIDIEQARISLCPASQVRESIDGEVTCRVDRRCRSSSWMCNNRGNPATCRNRERSKCGQLYVTGRYDPNPSSLSSPGVPMCQDWVDSNYIMRTPRSDCLQIEEKTSQSYLTCVMTTAIGLMPIIGDMYTIGSLLSTDCSCSDTVSLACAQGAGQAVADKVRDAVVLRAATRGALSAGMVAGTAATGGAAVAAVAAIALASCLLSELLGFNPVTLVTEAEECLSPSSSMRLVDSGGSVKLSELTKGQHVDLYTFGGLNEISDKTYHIDAGGIHHGEYLGMAMRSEAKNSTFLEITTTGGRKVRVTPNHYLWIHPNQMVVANTVQQNDQLPYFDLDSTETMWDTVTSISTVHETGKLMPLVLGNADDEGDALVMADGLVIPIYSEGFRGVKPDGSHQIFHAWAHKLREYEKVYPCLFEESLSTGSLNLVTLMEFYTEHLQIMTTSGGAATPTELDPEHFINALKEMAPKSIAVQAALGECPELARKLEVENLHYVRRVRDEVNAVKFASNSTAEQRKVLEQAEKMMNTNSTIDDTPAPDIV